MCIRDRPTLVLIKEHDNDDDDDDDDLCCIAVQERTVFRRIVLKNAYNRRKMFEELLESVPLLKSLNVRLSTVYSCR